MSRPSDENIEITVDSIQIEYLPRALEWDAKEDVFTEAPKIVISLPSPQAPSNGKRLIIYPSDLMTLKVAIYKLEAEMREGGWKDPSRGFDGG